MAESLKGTKKVPENRKSRRKSAENRKNDVAGNRKMPYLSHGKPEKMENMAETGKHNIKFAETGKVLLEAADSRKSPIRQ